VIHGCVRWPWAEYMGDADQHACSGPPQSQPWAHTVTTPPPSPGAAGTCDMGSPAWGESVIASMPHCKQQQAVAFSPRSTQLCFLLTRALAVAAGRSARPCQAGGVLTGTGFAAVAAWVVCTPWLLPRLRGWLASMPQAPGTSPSALPAGLWSHSVTLCLSAAGCQRPNLVANGL
jgi:hypothetical protein